MSAPAPEAPVLVCGEALFDVFAGPTHARGLTLSAVVGGSPLNVAVGLARLGRPVCFFGAVASDFLGEQLEAFLRDEGIGRQALVRSDAPTTLSLVGVDATGSPSYRFYGQGGADRMLLPAHLAGLPPDVAAVHVGSYACVVAPVDATLRLLIEARHRAVPIAYDVNVRLNVVADVARWRSCVEWMSSRVALMKLSDEDLGLLYADTEPDVLAREWLGRGVRLVVLTRGGAGATLWSAAGRVDVAAPVVSVVDTVGAGDTFQAALLAGLAEAGALSLAGLQGLSAERLQALGAFAARAAAITCTRPGADLPRRAELA